MNAVIVSFTFLASTRPCPEVMRNHQELLDRLPGIEASIALDSRSEISYLLTYEDPETLQAYTESEEFRRLCCQPGCTDVFVKEFNVLSIADDGAALESRLA